RDRVPRVEPAIERPPLDGATLRAVEDAELLWRPSQCRREPGVVALEERRDRSARRGEIVESVEQVDRVELAGVLDELPRRLLELVGLGLPPEDARRLAVGLEVG